jgi:phosphoribosylamine--glycine ligase
VRILVVGSGGREHALCWKLAHEPGVEIVCAPGNPGIASLARVVPVPAADIDGLLRLATREAADLTLVGPEAPLALGLVDRFAAAGRAAFGPTQGAARLETSKAFAKAFMQRYGIPTGSHVVAESVEAARRAVDGFGFPVVLKADGLAAGKGVVVAEDRPAAWAAIDAALVTRAFGAAGDRLIVEEFLRGEEASFFALCDGSRGVLVGTAQDHKRVFDGDRGPNTGGMGAFAPSVLVGREVRSQVERLILAPVLAGMGADGTPFRGFLYIGLMLTADGPRVVEFNVRFGDPEAQVVIPSLDEPLAPLLVAAATRDLSPRAVARTGECFVGTVLASGGYPGEFARGKPIGGLEEASALDGVLVFHAGTAAVDGRVVTDGGRVLTVVGRGPDYRTAISRAYDAARTIRFEGCHFRSDIGARALAAPGPPAF